MALVNSICGVDQGIFPVLVEIQFLVLVDMDEITSYVNVAWAR